MLKEGMDFNSLSVGIGSVILILTSYAAFIINSLQKAITDLKESQNEKVKSVKNDFHDKIRNVKDDIEKDVEHHRTDILDIYNNLKIHTERIAKVEADVNTIKIEHGKNHK